MPQESLTSTAERTLRLAELLLTHSEGLTPQEMLLRVGGSRSTLYALLKTLKTLGYLEQAERRGRYRCGPRLAAWRKTPDDHQHSLLSAFYQESARRDWSETLLLVVPAEDDVLILAQAEGTQRLRSVFSNGETTRQLPASRQVMLANPTASVKTNGYALQQSNGLFELAVPVCPDGSSPQAALVLSAPVFRWQEDSLIATWLPEMRVIAARLSYRLGALTYTPYQRSPRSDLPAAAPLADAEINSFLQGPWAARLACLRPDGTPHVIPVWQEWDGRQFTLIAWEGSQWAEYVNLHPEVSLTIDEPWPPLRRVIARGKARALALSESQLLELVARLYRRYLGGEGGSSSGPLKGAFRIELDSLRGWQGLPGSAAANPGVGR